MRRCATVLILTTSRYPGLGIGSLHAQDEYGETAN